MYLSKPFSSLACLFLKKSSRQQIFYVTEFTKFYGSNILSIFVFATSPQPTVIRRECAVFKFAFEFFVSTLSKNKV